jgi:sn-glycerol 3-phosphate transport system substrate-binding protein
MKAGDPPEIAVVEVHSVMSLAAGGQVANTSELIKADKSFNLDDVLPGMLKNVRWKEQLYGVPFVRSTPVLYYNKQRFKDAGLDPNKPPKTWTELREMARKLTTDPEQAYAIALKANAWHFDALVFGAGGELANQDGTRSEFVEPVMKPLQLWADMIHKDKTARLGDRDAFLSGQAAMFIESTALVASFEKSNPNLDFGTALFPVSEGQKPGVVAGGGVAVIPAKVPADKQRAAFQFLTFFISTTQTGELSRRTGYVPIRKSAIELLTKEGFYKEHPNYVAGVEQMEFARELPPVANWPQAMGAITRAMQSCLERNEPAAKVLVQAGNEVDQILKKEKAARP